MNCAAHSELGPVTQASKKTLVIAVMAPVILAALPSQAEPGQTENASRQPAPRPHDSRTDDPTVDDSSIDQRRAEHSPDPAPHGALTVGGFAALTGPVGQGFAADTILYPGRFFGRYGLGVSYRGSRSAEQGLLVVNLAFAAGASRPGFEIALHGDIGAAYGPFLPVIGGGVRTQLGVWGPLVVTANTTGHLLIDGIDSRLAVAVTLSAGIAR
ncbi:MAG: hypothetical protein MJE77_44600 [Proteobacteria bacterium]|nr:hypothetical protein [Pseudomonadota bacterium]